MSKNNLTSIEKGKIAYNLIVGDERVTSNVKLSDIFFYLTGLPSQYSTIDRYLVEYLMSLDTKSANEHVLLLINKNFLESILNLNKCASKRYTDAKDYIKENKISSKYLIDFLIFSTELDCYTELLNKVEKLYEKEAERGKLVRSKF